MNDQGEEEVAQASLTDAHEETNWFIRQLDHSACQQHVLLLCAFSANVNVHVRYLLSPFRLSVCRL